MYSIVIPYYQRESGILARCLEHIANQSAFDIVEEILLVDDGSPISAESELKWIGKELSTNTHTGTLVLKNGKIDVNELMTSFSLI